MSLRLYILVLPILLLWHGVEGHINFPHTVSPPWSRILETPDVDYWSLYLPTEVDPNSTCRSALNRMENALDSHGITWAHKMVDSWGKRSIGIHIGYTFYLGHYDECVDTDSPHHRVRGRYCTIALLKSTPNEAQEAKPQMLLVPPWQPKAIQRAAYDIYHGKGFEAMMITYATCMPDACTSDDLKISLTEVLNATDYIIADVNCHTDTSSDNFTPGDIAFITLLSVFFVLLFLASVIDIYIQKTKNKKLAKGGLRFLLPFSAYTNIEKIFYMNTEPMPGTITCLHGIRVLSMTWVVTAHQQQATILYTANWKDLPSKVDGFLFEAILNGFPSVDTFFFMSGLLMTYSVLREFKRSGRFNIAIFYIHRILRLIPPIGLVAGFYGTIVIYFVSGPLFPYWENWRNACQTNWWRDVLLIDNYLPDDNPTLCLGQCWYLAVDSQLYLIAPLIILPLLYKSALGKIWLYLLTLASMIIPAWLTYANDLPPTFIFTDPKLEDYFNIIYMMPWCRAGPWIVGIWLGLILHSQGTQKRKLQEWQVTAGWTVAVVVGLLVVFGFWGYNSIPPKIQYGVMTQITYSGIHRSAWGAAVAWVVYACYNGYGGIVDDFLSHPIWQPLSRLTFTTYLIAMPLQYAIAYSAKSPFYFNHYNKVIESVGALIMSVVLAVLVTLTVESPIIGLEKLLLKRPGPRADAASKQPSKLQGVDNEAFNEMEDLKGKEQHENIEHPNQETIISSF